MTRIAFGLGPQETFRAESVVTLGGGSWSTSRYRQEPDGVDAQASREAAGLGPDTLPGYAEFVLLRRAADADLRVEFTKLTDSEPTTTARETTVAAEGTATITPPGGDDREVGVLTVRSDGTLDSTHWTAGGQIIGSDWNGARSFLVPDAASALDGLPDAMQAFLRDGFNSGVA